MKHTLYVTLLALTLGVAATASPAEASHSESPGPRTNLCAYLKAGELIGVVDLIALLKCRTITSNREEGPPSPGPATFKRQPPCLGCGGVIRVESDRARGDDGQPVEPRREPKVKPRPKVKRFGGS